MTFTSDTVPYLAEILLHPLEIYENPLHSSIFSVIFTFISVIGVLGNIIGFLNTTGIVNSIEAFTGICIQLNGILLYLQVLKSRKKLIRLFSKLEKKQETSDLIPNRIEVFVKIKLIWFSIALVVSASVYVSTFLISYLFEDRISDKHSLLISFWFSCGDLQKIFCWRTSTKRDLLTKNIILFFIAVIQIFSYTSTFTLFGIVVGELEMHLENISKRVDNFMKMVDQVDRAMLEQANLEHDLNRIRVQNEEIIYGQFLPIIKYQQFLYSCISLAIDVWKTYVSYFYVSTFIDVTLFLFVTDMERGNEKLLALKALTWGQMRLLMAFIIAHCSQNISHLNEDFITQLTKIRWYERDIRFQKLYLRLLSFHQRTNVMKIYGIVELNFNFFGTMLKNIYSFVNLMILKYGK